MPHKVPVRAISKNSLSRTRRANTVWTTDFFNLSLTEIVSIMLKIMTEMPIRGWKNIDPLTDTFNGSIWKINSDLATCTLLSTQKYFWLVIKIEIKTSGRHEEWLWRQLGSNQWPLSHESNLPTVSLAAWSICYWSFLAGTTAPSAARRPSPSWSRRRRAATSSETSTPPGRSSPFHSSESFLLDL